MFGEMTHEELLRNCLSMAQKRASKLKLPCTPDRDGNLPAEVEDLRQAGVEGAMEARRHWRPEAGPFRPFAYTYIQHAMAEEAHRLTFAARIPQTTRDRFRAVMAANQQDPDLAREDAPRFGLTKATFDAILAVWHHNVDHPGDDLDEGFPEVGPEETDPLAKMLPEALDKLDPDHRRILDLSYFESMTDAQVAEAIGLEGDAGRQKARRMRLAAEAQLKGLLV